MAKFLLLFLLTSSFLFSQENKKDEIDSTKKDIVFVIPKYEHSSIFQLGKSNNLNLKKGSFSDIQYTSYKEIFERKLPTNVLGQGSFDYFSNFSTMGSLPTGNSIKFNNRTLNFLDFASYNLSAISPEFTENLEFLIGSDAIVFGDNSTGSLVNLQEIRYNSAKPFTRLWFSEGGYEYLAADGVFSQNFAPNWNFTFGFRNSNNDGRFNDTWINLWTVRGILRYNPSNYRSISLVHNYTNYGMGTGGGVNYDSVSSIYESIEAFSFYTGLNEREFRHDLTLTYTDKFDSLSLQAIHISAYLTRSEWDRKPGDVFRFDANDTLGNIFSYFNMLYGANFSYELEFIKDNFIKVGGDFNYYSLDSNYMYNEYRNFQTAFFGHLRLNFTDNLGLSGGARLTNKYDKVSLSLGSKLHYNYSDFINLFADASYAERIPEISEGLSLKSEKNLLLIVGNKSNIDSLTNFEFTAFYRLQKDPIVVYVDKLNNTPSGITFKNEETYAAYGANIKFSSHIFNLLNYQIIANLNIGDLSYSDKKILPNLSSLINLYYEYNTGKSILRVGTEAKFASSFNGLRFIPFYKVYAISDYNNDGGLYYLNPYAFVKLGDATIRIMFENVLNSKYYDIAISPGNGTNMRISFSWTFLED